MAEHAYWGGARDRLSLAQRDPLEPGAGPAATAEVEPVLRAGMDFLCDDGRSVGCSANRYLRVLGEDGQAVDKSFGMSWWCGLADLDRRAKDHPTHKAIFGQAMKCLSAMGAPPPRSHGRGGR